MVAVSGRDRGLGQAHMQNIRCNDSDTDTSNEIEELFRHPPWINEAEGGAHFCPCMSTTTE